MADKKYQDFRTYVDDEILVLATSGAGVELVESISYNGLVVYGVVNKKGDIITHCGDNFKKALKEFEYYVMLFWHESLLS